ncbi:SAM-dependent methyltransferase [Acidithiobacillus caldus]|nr:SAM-dependent methyltransferase [Acidithiobacillus caldus]MBU2771361.1 SAM-dependent methyltransferase [Acidithiobacillus caldus]
MQGDVTTGAGKVAGDLCTHAACGAGNEDTFGVFGQKEPMRDTGSGFVTHSPDRRKFSLPPPDLEAAAHSAALRGRILARIAAAGGSISFADYLEAVLYTPGLGYYMAGQRRFGPDGDFVTAPEMGPVLATVLARWLEDYRNLGDGILEFGGGSGALARQLRAILPSTPYAFLDRSADLVAQQAKALPEGRVLQDLPEAWRGVFLAHEVLDALPFLAVEWDGERLWERRVAMQGDDFCWTLAPLAAEHAATLRPYAEHWPAPYQTEIRPLAEAWLAAAAASLAEGALVLIDYGQESSEYYHPQRRQGSLRAYYRHRVLDDPFFLPGLCDLTAHVDFGALRRAAARLGLRERWYGPLARFLVEGGLAELYPGLAAGRDGRGLLALNNEIKRLTLPQEMGESFKVLLLEKTLLK